LEQASNFSSLSFRSLNAPATKIRPWWLNAHQKRKQAAAQGIATRERREEGFCFSPEQTKVSRRQSQPNGLVMFTVCEVLQRARLDQGIDLATVAARTKINAKYLQAIEADDRKSLPGGFFYKSFVHQYATFRLTAPPKRAPP
jgi:Helix-turn-helix domain